MMPAVYISPVAIARSGILPSNNLTRLQVKTSAVVTATSGGQLQCSFECWFVVYKILLESPFCPAITRSHLGKIHNQLIESLRLLHVQPMIAYIEILLHKFEKSTVVPLECLENFSRFCSSLLSSRLHPEDSTAGSLWPKQQVPTCSDRRATSPRLSA